MLAATVAVTGCFYVSPQDRCASYGLTPGTEAFAECVGAETRYNRNARSERIRDWQRANEARGGSSTYYCPIGMTC